MRALAITLVLLHHFFELVRTHAPWSSIFLGGGLTGVSIFFALSGFLIGRILLKLGSRVVIPGELLKFWARRWLRTLPIYYVVLLARSLMAFAIILCLHLNLKFLHVVPAYFVFMQSWAWPLPPFFIETWSLAVEEWFYLLFPLFWVVAIYLGLRPFKAFVIASVFMLLVSSITRLGVAPSLLQNWLDEVYFTTIYRFDGVALGLLGAALSVASPRIWKHWRWPGLVLGVGLLWLDRHLTQLDFMYARNEYLGTWHCSTVGLGSALLLPWCSSVDKLFWQPLQNLVGIISRWSYSLYLTHGAFLVLVQIIFASQIKQSTAWAWALLLITAGLTFVVAGALHRWIEKPGMALRERWTFTRDVQATFLRHQTSV